VPGLEDESAEDQEVEGSLEKIGLVGRRDLASLFYRCSISNGNRE
jgi:hypothetical protein